MGFGDIPPEAFFAALRLIRVDGWVAFNIKETFLDHSDNTGFSQFVRELIFSKYLRVFDNNLGRLERPPFWRVLKISNSFITIAVL